MNEAFDEANPCSGQAIAKKILKELRREIRHYRMLAVQGAADLAKAPCPHGNPHPRLLRYFRENGGIPAAEEYLKIADSILPLIENSCEKKIRYIRTKVTVISRKNPYRDIYNALENAYRQNMLEIDYDDVEIILDAHEAGLTFSPLIFITGDYAHIIAAKDLIVQLTSLTGVYPLGEYEQFCA